MLLLKELELVFGHTDGQTDSSGRTDRRGSQNSYLDTAISIFFLQNEKNAYYWYFKQC